MKIIIIPLMMLLVPLSVFAQESTINYDKCEYVMLHQNVFAPFYIHVNHDPAVAQIFKQRHDDNPTVVPFQRAPENIEAGQATWFEFGAQNNATATYDFELGLEYAVPSSTPRVITVQLFSNNNIMMEKKFYQEDTIGCIAFKIHAVPPPHQFTETEILEIAKMSYVAESRQYAEKIDENTLETKGLRNWLIIEGLIIIMVLVFVVVKDRVRDSNQKKRDQEYVKLNQMFTENLKTFDILNKAGDLRLLNIEKSNEKFRQSVMGIIGEKIASVETNVQKFLSDLRAELELLEIKEEKQITTFADLEEIKPETLAEPVEKQENNLPDFDIESLKAESKNPLAIFNRKKSKQEKQKPLEELPTEELERMFDEYNQKARDDLYSGLGQTENYAMAIKLSDIINRKNSGDKT